MLIIPDAFPYIGFLVCNFFLVNCYVLFIYSFDMISVYMVFILHSCFILCHQCTAPHCCVASMSIRQLLV